jgi:hypothetical protein
VADRGPSRDEAARNFRAASSTRLVWCALLVLTPTAAYFALFSWDHGRDIFGRETSGPYSGWQVALLVAVLLVLVVSCIRRGVLALPTLIVPPVLTFWFWQDWAQTDDSGLYAFGVVLLAAGSFAGIGVVSALARSYFAEPDLRPEGPDASG